MPTTLPTDDQDLDPLEHADQEDLQEEEETPLVDVDVHPAVDPDTELVEEIEKVAVEEDSPAKHKAHMIPRHLIDSDLRPEDLWDEGTI
jgi:hypothetical protein